MIARVVDEVRGLTWLCAIDFRPLFDLEALPSPTASPSFSTLRPRAHMLARYVCPPPPHTTPTQTRTHAHRHPDPPQATHLFFRRGRVGRRTHNLAKSGKLLDFSLGRSFLLSGQLLDDFAHILPSTRKARRRYPGTRARALALTSGRTQGVRQGEGRGTHQVPSAHQNCPRHICASASLPHPKFSPPPSTLVYISVTALKGVEGRACVRTL